MTKSIRRPVFIRRITLVIITVLLLAIRINLFGRISGDMKFYLIPWFEEMKAKGGFSALRSYPGNYNAPYMTIMAALTYLPFRPIYLIKIVSVFFDILLAVACSLVAYEVMGAEYTVPVYIMILCIPTIVMNSSWWGQCDSIYSSFAVLAIYFLLKEKYFRSFVFLGISLAFKLQMVFILPVFIIIYFVKRNFSISYFLLLPVMDIVLCFPALALGMPFRKIIDVYAGQSGTTTSDKLNRNFPNLYACIGEKYQSSIMLRRTGIMIALCFFIILLLICMHYKENINKKNLLFLALVSTMGCVTLLPCMHERYGYLADVFVLLCFISDRKKFILPVIIMLGSSCITYMHFLNGLEIETTLPFLGVTYTVVFAILVFMFVKEIAGNTSQLNEIAEE